MLRCVGCGVHDLLVADIFCACVGRAHAAGVAGGSQELLSQQENRVAAEQRHGETAAQLKAILEAITQAPQKGADLVDANMVCPRLLQRF